MEVQGFKNILLDSNNILVSTSSFFTLKKTLLENIGSYKTRGFLFRFGYEIGVSAANAKRLQPNQSSKRGSRSMHAMYGHVRDVIIDPNFNKLLDGTLQQIKGQWIDSFEAKIHKEKFDISSECVCFTLCGYVSGFLSTQYHNSLIAVETKCIAKGDSCCEFEVRLEENWDADIIKPYKSANILNELETTYDALFHHKQLLDRISTFHSNLTQSVTEKLSMEEIIQSAYDVLEIPILIENIHGDEILQIGLSNDQLQLIKGEQNNLEYLKEYSNNSFYEGSSHSKLISPVLINKKHYANCSFVYLSPQSMEENDHLYLDRISNVVSLCLLYENAKIEEQERLTNTLLNRLIHKRFQSTSELDSYLKFFPFKIKSPFSTTIIRVSQKSKTDSFIDLHEQLLLFSRNFQIFSIPSIFSVFRERIVILNTQYSDKIHFANLLKSIIKHIEKRNPNYLYSIGISKPFDDLLQFEKSLEEAQISEKITKQDQLKYYEDLGLLGNFIANISTEQLHEIAKAMLNDLYDFHDLRKKDLLYTLYQYLLNGQKLKETMEVLAISMGGLQYRIKQIELLLRKSLKDSSFSAYLLLILESLILLDELQFD